jgi:ABC-2 type transport system ATP-binding protein
VRVQGLRVVRGKREVLRNISLTIPGGSITGLIGPSGCGKSTLMRSIVGVQIMQAGDVTVLGFPAGSSELRRRIGYGTQSQAIYSDLTVVENLRYFGTVLAASPRGVDAVIESVGLSQERNQPVARRTLLNAAIARRGHCLSSAGNPRGGIATELAAH